MTKIGVDDEQANIRNKLSWEKIHGSVLDIMFESYRFRNAAFALAGLLVVGIAFWGTLDLIDQRQDHRNAGAIESRYQQEKTAADIQRTCTSLSPSAASICISEHLAAQEKEKLQNEDARAQKEMALGAFWLWILGSIQAFVAVGGIYYIANTLAATKEANELVRAERRAWLSVNLERVTEDMWLDDCFGVDIAYSIENFGKHPAFNGVVYTEAVPIWRDHSAVEVFTKFVDRSRSEYARSSVATPITIFPEQKYSPPWPEVLTAENLPGGRAPRMFQLNICIFYTSGDVSIPHHTAVSYSVSRNTKYLAYWESSDPLVQNSALKDGDDVNSFARTGINSIS